MDLVDLTSLPQVLDNGQDFRACVFQALGSRSQAQLKSIVRTLHHRLVPFDGFKHCWRIPVVNALIAKRQPRWVIGMAGHSDIVLSGYRDYLLKKIADAFPVVF